LYAGAKTSITYVNFSYDVIFTLYGGYARLSMPCEKAAANGLIKAQAAAFN
jgi:hypothetical protein